MLTYPVLFALVLACHGLPLPFLKYLIPVFLFTVPYAVQGGIKLGFRAKDILTGIIATVVVLIPVWFVLSATGRSFIAFPAGAMLFQLVGVALPEEIYFRGFLQSQIGNTLRGIVLTSFLFAFMHLPQFIFYHDMYALLTFFPSLVMGFLYWKTSSVLPPAIFHFLSNVVFLGYF